MSNNDDSGLNFVKRLQERFANDAETVDADSEMLEDPTGITVTECRPEDLDEETLNTYLRFKESYETHQSNLKEKSGDNDDAFNSVRVRTLAL